MHEGVLSYKNYFVYFYLFRHSGHIIRRLQLFRNRDAVDRCVSSVQESPFFVRNYYYDLP